MSLMDDLNRAARSVMDFFFPRQCLRRYRRARAAL